MAKLTEKKDWDVIYAPDGAKHKRRGLRGKAKALVTKYLGDRALGYVSNYAEHLLWDVIYPTYLLKTKRAKVLEVGSAPGHHLVRLARTFGFEPYGVEYSDSGAALNRRVFSANGIDPDNVIHADFLSEAFHEQYRGRFDVVMSRGFIEHFTDVEEVIDKHLNVLADGGVLVVSIPNYGGANYLIKWLLRRDNLAMHNLAIMNRPRFARLFDRAGLAASYCDYYGTFNLGLFSTRKGSPKRFLKPLLRLLQVVLNVVFRLLFGDRGAESGWFSPYLLFIGTKVGGA